MSEPYRIAVCVPSRGRPHNIARLHSVMMDTAARPDLVDLFVRIDHDDTERDAYLDSGVPVAGWVIGPRLKLAASWNEQAGMVLHNGVHYSHAAFWGDDVIPETQGWDVMAAERTLRDGPGFVYGPDGIWDHTLGQSVEGHLALPTATIISREIIAALGYVSPPGLVHLCIDVAWRDLGLAAGCLFYEPGMMIRHLHRLTGAPDDDTYREANDTPQAAQDHRAYQRWHASTGFSHGIAALQEVRSAWKTREVWGD